MHVYITICQVIIYRKVLEVKVIGQNKLDCAWLTNFGLVRQGKNERKCLPICELSSPLSKSELRQSCPERHTWLLPLTHFRTSGSKKSPFYRQPQLQLRLHRSSRYSLQSAER